MLLFMYISWPYFKLYPCPTAKPSFAPNFRAEKSKLPFPKAWPFSIQWKIGHFISELQIHLPSVIQIKTTKLSSLAKFSITPVSFHTDLSPWSTLGIIIVLRTEALPF